MGEIIFLSVYGLIAFFAAIGLILGFATTLHWGHKREESLIPYIVYPVFLAVAVGALLSGRNLNLSYELYGSAIPKSSIVAWITRLTSIFIVVMATERIARRILITGKKPDIPVLLVSAFCFYFATNVLTSAFLGTYPAFSHDNLYTFLAGIASFLLCRKDGDTAILSTRNALFVFLILSVVPIAWRPELVFSKDYQGLIPGLTIRYAGLSNHPNALGPIVTLFLLCLWNFPFKKIYINRFAWTLGLGSLLLAQSKTSWIACALCMSCVGYYKYRQNLNTAAQRNRHFSLSAGLLASIFFALCVPFLVFMFGNELISQKMNAFLNTREGSDLLTLTGRDQIWEAALREWRANPLFGYGLTIWSEAHRAKIGLVNAFHAHNQFYQTLASAGLVGAAGLIVYSVVLGTYSFRAAKYSQGFTLAVFILLVIRSISEVPLTIVGFGTEQLTHLILLMVISSFAKEMNQAKPAALSKKLAFA